MVNLDQAAIKVLNHLLPGLLAVVDEKDGRFLAQLSGQTSSHHFRGEITATGKEVRFVYEFEMKRKREGVSVQLSLNGAVLEGKRFEWVRRAGIPEAIGYFTAEAIRVDNPPAYLTIYGVNGRTVTLRFPAPSAAAITPRQWHRFRTEPKACTLAISLTPPAFAPGQPIAPGQRGKVEFTIAVE